MIQFNDTLLNKNKAHLYTTSFDIEENGIYCLVGGNGLGKSTLINNFNKIEKPYPRTFLGKTQLAQNQTPPPLKK